MRARIAASWRGVLAERAAVCRQDPERRGCARDQGRWSDDCGRQSPVHCRANPWTGTGHSTVGWRPSRERYSLGQAAHRSKGVAMIVIRCETGDHVSVAVESLAGANLTRLNLHRALLDDQVLRRADLSDSDLRSAWLERSDLSEANLSRVRLPACNASRANFARANLTGAFMRSGIYEGADFTEADFTGADVGRARFAGAMLHGSNLELSIDLQEADLTGALADESTRWPRGFDPKVSGVLLDPRK